MKIKRNRYIDIDVRRGFIDTTAGSLPINLLVDLLEEVLESTIVSLQDGILGAQI